MIMSFKITWKTYAICVGISVIITLALWNNANIIIQNFILQDFIEYPTRIIVANIYIYIILLVMPIMAIHEAIYSISYIIFGGQFKYEFRGIYIYTMEISEKPIQRTKYLIMMLLPITVISLFSLFLPSWLGGMVYFLNLLGSSGDLYTAITLMNLQPESKIIIRKYGFDVI